MLKLPSIARDISYSYSAQTKAGKTVIKLMENTTGRLRLIKRAWGYEQEVANGRDFWQVMVDRYGLSLDIVAGDLSKIPTSGPMIMIANHPYGILDGLMMGHILSTVRGDFRILANTVFRKSEDLQRVVLPISFDETKDAVRENLATRKSALTYLAEGGAIGVFPGGTVSTAVTPFAQPMDPGWRSFTARMISKSNAIVLPVYFEGQTSLMFQLASHLHNTLRMGLLIKEFKKRVDTPVRVVVGDPITKEDLKEFSADARAMMDFLRKKTYELSPTPLRSYDYGFEFETRHKA